VYAVKPGETVQYETAPKPGDTTQLPAGTVCRGNLIQRVESGPDSLTGSGKTVTPEVCSLLTAEDFTAIVGAPADPDPGDNKCDWFIQSWGGDLALYRDEHPSGGVVYDKTYPSPCDGGKMGKYENHLETVCPKGKYTYTLDVASYETPSPDLLNQMQSLTWAVLNRAA
jgi:hypothetical protein